MMMIATPVHTPKAGRFYDDAAMMVGIEMILRTLYDRYGYDFSQYSRDHIKRRIIGCFMTSGLQDIHEFHLHVSHDPCFAALLLRDLSITVTEMFRDPTFFLALRQQVIPFLKTYPFIKIWHAGCATGEEAYSMAILLKEEGLYDRSLIYATDFNQHALDKAKAGIYPDNIMKKYTANYQQAGGKQAFSCYYISQYGNTIMDHSLKQNIVWANHNLVSDDIFAEVHLVLCRNVLIYFSNELQDKVHKLFDRSLVGGGILCLGSKEGLINTTAATCYSALDARQRIFRKKY